MIKNYLKIALRNFSRNKVFAFINISGLAIGISAALVIYLIVQYEFSYDTFHKDGDRIYRVVTNFKSGEFNKNSGVPIPVAGVVNSEITGLETATKFYNTYNTKVTILSAGAQPAVYKKQTGIVFADDKYFKLFDYEWIVGSRQMALSTPNQVVLTESRAKTYFGDADISKAIGREIIYDDSITTVVSGVVKDFSKPSDFTFKEFISFATASRHSLLGNYIADNWNSVSSSFQLFVKLKPGTATRQVEMQLASARKKYLSAEEAGSSKYLLQNLTDIHSNTDYDSFDQRQAHKPTLYGLLAVAFFLLALGCINFINLTTAQASQRAKEIGIRKTMGGSKKQLIIQFLSETFFLTSVATLISLAITPLILKIFSDFIPAGISINSVAQTHVVVFLIALVCVVSFFSGFYPALVLAKFQPATVLKNQSTISANKTRKLWLRKSLTVTQFVIAQFLIIATLVISKQIYFSINKESGYKKDAIITITTPFSFDKTKDKDKYLLLDKLNRIPELDKVVLAGMPPASQGTMTTTIKSNNGKNESATEVEMKYADGPYFDIYKMKLLAGRYLQKSDSGTALLINYTYAKALGFTNPQDALGKSVTKDNKPVPIAGVLADFNTKSTHIAIKPLAYAVTNRESQLRTFHIALKPRTGGDEWNRAIAKAAVAFKTVYPDEEFKYEFFDESIAAFYKSEQDISRLLKWASGLTIFISCLGLLGIVIYTTNQRTKEIGVRKVLGASIGQIVSLLSRDFMWLVLIAFAIAAPIAWLTMHSWLNDFAYRTAISWWLFAITGTGMLLIALLILSIRTIRSATENPVKSLRTE